MGRQPHVLVLPFPGQGHIVPIMKFAIQIAAQGVKVTFVNTEFVHAKMMASLPEKAEERSLINFVSLPDGLELEDDRADLVKLTESVHRTMPGYLEDFILKMSNINEQITCVIADTAVGWAHEMAKKLGIEAVAFWPSAGAGLAFSIHIPQLLEAGLISKDGTLMTDEPISLSKDLPPWTSSDIGSDPLIQKLVFEFCYFVSKYAKFHDWIVCNSNYELESAALQLIPNILPIGPLLSGNHLTTTFVGNLWPEDSTCLEWLDKQSSASVIFVAFGSTTTLSAQQVQELALGLELTGQPFLWVVRSEIMSGSLAKFPDGFIDRVAERAKFVEWAPQEKVLAHPSVACFMSHCGWNSILEGLGVPFLCWPYFADHFYNKKCICDVWKFGLGFIEDENGIITRHEISTKIKTLLSSDDLKANALHMKELARKSCDEGGSSFRNLKKFIEHIKSL
ncbi:UDP-glycosyltransferase 83A1-like [Durio zibethinus]|uniref:UDP-glycosyltransferase 83A1-like n=1 Tax=Durio zibethinus TaxID=66656 RepID=A0A6P5YCF0_DURZI|nr:UDP-glycosyltransferase 83A1-like [Durio zibethinus]